MTAPTLAADVLADHTALWEAVCAGAHEYLVVVDRDGLIRSCNRVDEGFTLEQVVGHSIVRFTTGDSSARVLKALGEVFDTGEPRTLETTVHRLSGDLNYFSLRLMPLVRDGRTIAVLACCESTLPLKTTELHLHRERNTLRRLLEIQEGERQLIAYEIHDGLAQYLSGAIMHLQACQHALGAGPGHAELAEGLRLLQAATAEARRLIGGLRPPALDELGIVAAIESLVAEARTDVPVVEFTHSVPGQRLSPDLETAVFRIVQESLSNVRKHAAARRVGIVLERTAAEVRLVVTDDGRGFDATRVPDDRFGLEGIRQRARLVGGEARIDSAADRGTTIVVSFPAAAPALSERPGP